MDRISKGLGDSTPFIALKEQVRSIPQKLQAVYADTLRRIDLDYSTEAYIMLQVALCSLVPLPVDVFMASVENELHADRIFNRGSADSVISIMGIQFDLPVEPMIDLESRLASRSGRFLELTSSVATAGDTATSGDNEASLVVQLIHQTAREYFLTVSRHELELFNIRYNILNEDRNIFLVKLYLV